MSEASFHALGPDAVLDAIEAAGLRPTGHCSVLRALENRVFDVRLEDGRHVVVKFYRPGRWSREAILEEHRFLLDLRDAEIPVCAPLAFDGETLLDAGGIHYALWDRVGGREPEELGEETLEILGRLMARIHNVGALREAPHRIRLDAETGLLEPLDFLLDEGFLPDAYADRYADVVEALAEILVQRGTDVPLHRIHGDCHLGNLLHGEQGWFFLDFDDFVVGPAVHDVWVLVPGRDAAARRQREHLVDAYRQFRNFESGWLDMVEPLRATRILKISSWIALRWKETAFRSTFPHFGTDLYWEQETQALEELLDEVCGAD